MSKRILAALFSIVLVIGMIPFGAQAEKVSENTYTVPTAGASASSDKPLITIGTVSDGHVDYGIQNSDPYIRSSYIKAMNALKAEGVDIILDGGDMVSDNEDGGKTDFRWEKSVYDRVISQYKKYSSAASTTGVTLWACGNHDYEVGRLTEGKFSEGDYNSYKGFMETMIATAGQPVSLYTEKDDTTGSVNAIIEDNWLGAHFNVKGFDFIIVNPPYAKSDIYTVGTLKWLDETLAKIGTDKTVFITGHYPLQDSKGPATTQITSLKGAYYTNFMNVMKKYDNAIYLFGHIHDTDTGYISSDTFERITHYDKDGKVVSFRSVNPTSFVSAYMGSAGFYSYSYNPGGLTSAEPKIIQAMTIKVYTDRIEFKMINCGEKEGAVREPMTYTVKRGSNVPAVEFKNTWTLPSDILTAPNFTSGNFGLYYMDQTVGELSNDWNGSNGATYINIKGGHGCGTFAAASGGGISVYPDLGKTAVVQFTAPSDGLYLYEVPVISIAMTANGLGNKQIVFSVMKDGVIYDITQPTYNKNFAGSLTGTIKLKKGDKLLFTADWYVKHFLATRTPADHNGKCWMAGTFNTIAVAQVDSTSTPSATKKYSFDGSGLNFTESGYSIKSNEHYTLTAIDMKNKKLLNLERGEMTIYTGPTGAPIYKGGNGQNVGAACYYTNGNLMFGPFGPGNADKSTATAIAFTAPEKGMYNMTALLLHDWDYNANSQSTFSMVYEILDSDLNVIFSGNTSNVYTGANIQHTYSRAAGTVYLDKGEKVYLAFRSAPEATVTASDAVCMRVVSLATTQVSANCEHEWNNSVCDICGKTCAHSWKNGACTVCSKVCSHSWKNGKCSVCSLACNHSYGNDDVCDTCGYKKPVVTTTKPTTTTPTTTTKPEDTTPDSTPSDTTDPDVTPGDTTVPDTTDPDSGSTTKPTDTSTPDVTDPVDNEQNKGDKKDNTVLIAVLVGIAFAVVIALVLIFFLPKKAKK